MFGGSHCSPDSTNKLPHDAEEEDVPEKSQASPIPSPSESVWSGFHVTPQLSFSAQMPSLSMSLQEESDVETDSLSGPPPVPHPPAAQLLNSPSVPPSGTMYFVRPYMVPPTTNTTIAIVAARCQDTENLIMAKCTTGRAPHILFVLRGIAE